MRLCPDFLGGKMKPFSANKYTFPDEGLAPFEHMVWDDKGPFQVRSIGGAIYIL
jgi:hypothetical protein